MHLITKEWNTFVETLPRPITASAMLKAWRIWLACLDEEHSERKETPEAIGFRVEKPSTWRHARLNAPSGWRLPTVSECAQVLEQIDYKDLWDHAKVQLGKGAYCWTANEYCKDLQYAEVVGGVGDEREIALRLKQCKLAVIYVEDL